MGEIDKYDDIQREVDHVNETRKWLDETYPKCPHGPGCPFVMTDTCGIKAHTQFYCTDEVACKMRRCMNDDK
jgi:hypothetical protein